MHSPTKQHDRELYQEIILMMEALVPYIATSDVAKEALEGFAVSAEKLKVKIQSYDYTHDDEITNRPLCP